MATLLEDAPISVKTVNGEEIGYPRNSPNIYSGFISVADALRLSKNTVAMRLCLEMGEEWVFDRLTRDYGLDLVRTSVNDGKALTDLGAAPLSLGQLTNGISLREVTRCYTTFARGGVLGSGRSYYAALTFDGKIIVESNTNDRRIYSPSTASIMTALLSGVVENGTASSVRLKYSVDTAGKTGTSSNNLDRVFIGYTPYYTAGVWCGYADGSTPVPKINPSHIAIWDEVMIRIHNNIAPQRNPLSFDMTGVIRLEFCPNCGGLAGQSGEKYVGYFINEDDIKAINVAREKGVHIVFASGRHLDGVKTTLETAGNTDYCISSAGAIVTDVNGDLAYSRCLDEKETHAALEFLKDRNLYIQVYPPLKRFLYPYRCEYTDIYEDHCTCKGDYYEGLYDVTDMQSSKLLIIDEYEVLSKLKDELINNR